MPRVLIVSAHFPPVNAPDMQRVRMSLPHFVDAGWEIVVLTVNDPEPLTPVEPDLLQSVPRAVRIVRATTLSHRWTRLVGVNNLGLRTLPFMYFTGTTLLREERFDLVYFSTTQFILCPLGRLWLLEFGVPYVIDLQDPWLSDYYTRPGSPRPPGGWKYWLTHAAARRLEGWTLRKCAHIISVSGAYLETLARRYPWFRAEDGSTLTFGAPDADFVIARTRLAHEPPLLPATAAFKIAYAGRLGPDMEPALDVLFAAVARCKDSPRPFELHFYGTSYAPSGQGVPTTTGLAARHGISHLVREHPTRIGYLDSLRLLLETDVALLLGSEDSAYSPSKVYPTLLTGKPVVAIAPSGSVLEKIIRELGGAALLRFNRQTPADAAAVQRVHEALQEFALRPDAPLGSPPERDRLMSEYSAAAIAAKQLALFNRLIARQRRSLRPTDLGEHWSELHPHTPEKT